MHPIEAISTTTLSLSLSLSLSLYFSPSPLFVFTASLRVCCPRHHLSAAPPPAAPPPPRRRPAAEADGVPHFWTTVALPLTAPIVIDSPTASAAPSAPARALARPLALPLGHLFFGGRLEPDADGGVRAHEAVPFARVV